MLSHVLLHVLSESNRDLNNTGVSFLDGNAVKQRVLLAKVERDRVVKFHLERHVLGLKNPKMPPAPPPGHLAQARTSGREAHPESGSDEDDVERHSELGASRGSGSYELGPDLHNRSRGVSPPFEFASLPDELVGRPSVVLMRPGSERSLSAVPHVHDE